MQRHPVRAVVGILLSLLSVVAVLAQGPPRAPVAVETVYPRYVARGQTTVLNVATPRGLIVQAAEVSPSEGVTVSGVAGEANGDQAIGWWEIALDVAKDAAPGARSLVLVTKTGRMAPTTIFIPTHVPAISELKVIPQPAQKTVDVQMAAADTVGDLGESPYVWFNAGCGGEPFVGVVRGKMSAGVVRASLPDLRTTQSGSPPANGPCELQVRVTDATGIESNTLKLRVN
jgi:hypothetical protein